ncbi:hypothetical protein EsH8_IV_000456 [Colletotrichum jinshuiense]
MAADTTQCPDIKCRYQPRASTASMAGRVLRRHYLRDHPEGPKKMRCGVYTINRTYFTDGHLRSCRCCRNLGANPKDATPEVMSSIEVELDASTQSTPEPNAGIDQATEGAHSGAAIVNSTVQGDVFFITVVLTSPPNSGDDAN